VSFLTQMKGTLLHPWKVNLSLLRPLVRVQTFLRRLGIAVGDEYWNGLLTLHARGLVYTTLVSLVPFLAVVFSVLKAFGVQQQCGLMRLPRSRDLLRIFRRQISLRPGRI